MEVTTAYVGRQSDLDPTYEKEEGVADKHYFTYRIRVSNCGWALGATLALPSLLLLLLACTTASATCHCQAAP